MKVDEILLILHPGHHIWHNEEVMVRSGTEKGASKRGLEFASRKIALYGGGIKKFLTEQENGFVFVVTSPGAMEYSTPALRRKLEGFEAFCKRQGERVEVTRIAGLHDGANILKLEKHLEHLLATKQIKFNANEVKILGLGEWKEVCVIDFLKAFDHMLAKRGILKRKITIHPKSISAAAIIPSKNHRRQAQRRKVRAKKRLVKRPIRPF